MKFDDALRQRAFAEGGIDPRTFDAAALYWAAVAAWYAAKCQPCTTIPSALQPICRVVNNNQPGWLNVVETDPNVTLEVGAALFAAADVWRAIGDLTFERDTLLLERNELVEKIALGLSEGSGT